MFLDLNAYFASVEQTEKPELRGKPVGVCAVVTDTSVLIAASYEAKKFGIKTGTMVGEAKSLCPDIVLTASAHKVYLHYHDRIKEAVETVLPIQQIKSIDEMSFQLIGDEQTPQRARELAFQIKEAIATRVAPTLKCSIGVAPNMFLAKLATDLQKPDGLVFIHGHELPERLRGLALTEFCGINRRMKARLNAAGIFTSDDMIGCNKEELRKAFGSIIGERWWYLLRGYDVPESATTRQTLGHSHILPPDFRTDGGCKKVMLRLLQKATARLRSEKLWPKEITIGVKGRHSWEKSTRMSPSQDMITLTQIVGELWETRDFSAPMQVYITFTHLLEENEVTCSLFDNTWNRSKLSETVDELNQRYGKNRIYLAALNDAQNTAPERIAFTKTNLFVEGKGDQQFTSEHIANLPHPLDDDWTYEFDPDITEEILDLND